MCVLVTKGDDTHKTFRPCVSERVKNFVSDWVYSTHDV